MNAMVQASLRAREADLAQPAVFWSLSREEFEGRVREAMARLPKPLLDPIQDALLVVAELPGAEVVADGIDPRICVMLDQTPSSPPARASGDGDGDGDGKATASADGKPIGEQKAYKMFVYQRNAERAAEDMFELNDELYAILEDEICATWPELAPYALRQDAEHEGLDD
jgi:hypothetical protein